MLVVEPLRALRLAGCGSVRLFTHPKHDLTHPSAPSRPHATTIHTMEAVDVSQQFTGTCPSSLLRLPCHTTNP